MIDCGEATQYQLRRYKIKFQRINHIFISHLHGDHYFGLMGLLSTMHMLGRTNELNIYGPPELKEIIDIQLKYSDAHLRYSLLYHALQYKSAEVIFEDEKLSVETIILRHRIPCCGFLFREKQCRNTVSRDAINGVSTNRVSTPPRSYAYCSDTAYSEDIIPQVSNVDLLYHETTFMHDMLKRAEETYHSTTIQAATIAMKAKVKKLLIGHFSARYKDLEPLLKETKSVFKDTVLAEDGTRYEM